MAAPFNQHLPEQMEYTAFFCVVVAAADAAAVDVAVLELH